jgi:cytoskeletal protein CcmA (bactofilin family)
VSIFNEKKDIAAVSKNNPISSIIGQDMILTGDMVFKSKIQIDGKINGNLNGDSLILSNTGKIEGDVEVKSITCYGQIDGNVKAGVLFLKKSGVINGRVETSDLSVESGGILTGEIKSSQQATDLKVLKGAADSSPPLEVPKSQKAL